MIFGGILKKRVMAGFTVEASVVMSIAVIVLAMLFSQAFRLHNQAISLGEAALETYYKQEKDAIGLLRISRISGVFEGEEDEK